MTETPSERMLAICRMVPVIPVLVIDRVEDAVPLARALVAGGLPVLEVTLRTEAALPAIRAMLDSVPEAVVGAGTVRTPADFRDVRAAGVAFAVSPGATPTLLDAAGDMPFLPGCATASEAMALAERGLVAAKFFPAGQAGGAAMLKAWASPIAGVMFCPTGGVGPGNAADYLALPNVICVGGSWVAPSGLIRSGGWDGIARLAAEASAMPR